MKVFLVTVIFLLSSISFAEKKVSGCAVVLQGKVLYSAKVTPPEKAKVLVSSHEVSPLSLSIKSEFEITFSNMVKSYPKIIQSLVGSNDPIYQFFVDHGAGLSKNNIMAPSLESIFEEVKSRPMGTILKPVFPVKVKQGQYNITKYMEYGSSLFTDGTPIGSDLKVEDLFSGTLSKENYVELLALGYLPLSSPLSDNSSNGLEQGAMVHDLTHVVILLRHPEMAKHLISGAKEIMNDDGHSSADPFSPINRLWERLAEFNEWHSVIKKSAHEGIKDLLIEYELNPPIKTVGAKSAISVKDITADLKNISFFKKRSLRIKVLQLLEESMIHYGGGSADGISRNIENYFYRDDVAGTPYSIYLALKNRKDNKSLAKSIALVYGFSQVSVGDVAREAFSLNPDTTSFVNYLYSGLGIFNNDTRGMFLDSENYRPSY